MFYLKLISKTKGKIPSYFSMYVKFKSKYKLEKPVKLKLS